MLNNPPALRHRSADYDCLADEALTGNRNFTIFRSQFVRDGLSDLEIQALLDIQYLACNVFSRIVVPIAPENDQ